MAIQRVGQDDPLSAGHTNSIVDQVNANRELGITNMMTQSGSTGTVGGYVPGGQRVRYFELSSALSPGSTAGAYIRNWDSEEEEYVTDLEADTFDVVDVLKEYRGRERDEGPDDEDDSGGTRGKHGSFGQAIQRHGQWEIEKLEPAALLIECLVDEAGDFETSAEEINIDAIVVIQPRGTAILMADVSAVENTTFDWEGDDDAPLYLLWHDVEEEWRPFQMRCKEP